MHSASPGPDPIAEIRQQPHGPAAAPSAGGSGALRIGVVRNPRSHRNRGCTDGSATHPELMFTAPETRDELARDLAGFAQRGIDVLIVDGGDGTVRDVLTRGASVFADGWPKLLVLPKGKTNALGVDLGMPKMLTLEQALAALPRAAPALRRPIMVERQDDAARPVLGFILGTGVFNAAIDAGQVAHRFGAFQGFAVGVTAAFGVGQALFGFGRSRWRELVRTRILVGPDRQPLPCVPDCGDDRRYASGYSTLGAFPLGMDPFAGTGGGIRFLVFDRPMRRVMALVPAILMGMDRPWLARLGIHRGAAEEIELDLGGGFILDGEAFPPGDYLLRLGPTLEFLVP